MLNQLNRSRTYSKKQAAGSVAIGGGKEGITIAKSWL
jgi:hypothetical protein